MAAIAAAAIAAVLAYGRLNSLERGLMSMAEPVAVVVAAADIRAGELIDANSVAMSRVPRRFLQPGAFVDIGDAAGRISSVSLPSGSQVTEHHTRRKGALGGISALIPVGMRTTTVSIDDPSGSLGIIRPNDRVDLLATFDLGSEANARRTTVALAEDVHVVAIGGMVDDIPRGADAPKKGMGIFGGSAILPDARRETILTLAADPETIQKIVFAASSAEIAAALRPRDDSADRQHTGPTTISSITGQHEELISTRKNFREYRGRQVFR